MKAERKRTFLEQLRAAFVIVIMIPVLCLGGFIFYLVPQIYKGAAFDGEFQPGDSKPDGFKQLGRTV